MQVDNSRLLASLEALWPGATDALPAQPEGARRLVLDSRRVQPGDVFIALPGVRVDGRAYIAQALDAGAALVLSHRDAETPALDEADDPRVLMLNGLRHCVGELGSALYQVPEDQELIGVTGTNGKSSVTHYLAALSEAIGRPCGLIGTLGSGRPGALTDSGLTTPGALALQARLGEMAAQGLDRVAMEVSSHALDQQRLEGCRVRAAVFTNLTRDHLDYHGGMAGYAAAKAKLFQRPELGLAVVNGDDPLARLMLAGLPKGVRVLATGEGEATTFRVLDWEPRPDGQRALIASPDGEFALALTLMGRFNLDNVLLAMATLYGLGESLEDLSVAAGQLAPVPGRMQPLSQPGRPAVVVDYAHTPDALDNALEALRAHLGKSGQLWCLFGCGGERDRGKRPLMAQAAAARADHLVITDDNPRGENAAAIREEILAGLEPGERELAWCIEGRREAIRACLAAAGPDDVVLIAGKGHETYQEIDGVRHAFSDVEEVERALEAGSLEVDKESRS
ncbi:UDP-N-acetylmuramoyl-L-alanyl-D-glutamate--2,6-diaminopimelate ligase [Halomonas sp. YLGW01]|uniref:UDP-N-acetylmuramoyl-L-alanyl-D-glutamate--2, 6-diaminopimelate ligase n=1 Tax=Halomonas sp. YLGW01 TaxID=2773308 RepID=UPI00177C6736|nr:UDP-N-acetylmuramoyl-L-alanyl-D-glutamate--2,6-diaminopimelate ligase [Halomonas sp. YLGW01]